MGQYQEVRQIYSDMLERLSNPDVFKTYLQFAAKFYKYNFSESLLIWAQRPDATMCASMNIWNTKIKRYVIRGHKSIGILDKTGTLLSRVFDISDTSGQTIPKQWKLTNRMYNELSVQLETVYGGDSIENNIKQIVSQQYDELADSFDNRLLADNLDECRDFIKAAAEYMTARRCEHNAEEGVDIDIDTDFSQYQHLLNDPEILKEIGSQITAVSCSSVHEIEQQINNVITQRRMNYGQSELRVRRADRNVQSNDSLDRGRGRTRGAEQVRRQVRNDVATVGENEKPLQGVSLSDEYDVALNGTGSGAGSSGENTSAGGGIREAKPKTSDIQLAGHSEVENSNEYVRGEEDNGGHSSASEIDNDNITDTTDVLQDNSNTSDSVILENESLETDIEYYKIVVVPINGLAYETAIPSDDLECSIEKIIGGSISNVKLADNNAEILFSSNSQFEERLAAEGYAIKGAYAYIGYSNGSYESLSNDDINHFVSISNTVTATAEDTIQPLESKADYQGEQLSMFAGEPKALSDKELKEYNHLVADVKQEFARWDEIHTVGNTDPFYADGVSLNLVRNHIIYDKNILSEKYSDRLPAIYNRDTPPEVEYDYMAICNTEYITLEGRTFRVASVDMDKVNHSNTTVKLERVSEADGEPEILMSKIRELKGRWQPSEYVSAQVVNDQPDLSVYIERKNDVVQSYIIADARQREMFNERLVYSFEHEGYIHIADTDTMQGAVLFELGETSPEVMVQNIQSDGYSVIHTEAVTSRPTVTCEWSESNAFEDGKTYSVAEFDQIMEQADGEMTDGKAKGLKTYGDMDSWRDADPDTYYKYLGCDKTKFTINMPDGTKYTERQDIGDGDGGLIDFLSQYPKYDDIIPLLKADMGIDKEETTEDYSQFFSQSETVATIENYQYTADNVIAGGEVARYDANISAIQKLKEIEADNRTATHDEQQILARYCGWGGVSKAFDAKNERWADRYAQLKALLTEDEYKAALTSTLTSYYTSADITAEINQTLIRLGFTGGNVLDPAMGTGAFFSTFPQDCNANFYGVELDGVTARIAKQLYPNSNIQHCGYENTVFNNASFDVAVGNVPFGDFSVVDSDYNRLHLKIHDYFFAKTADKLKPGGVMALITSSGTMDKMSSKVREYLAKRCDLIGAVRLPNNAFSSAGTKVSSDILVFQRRDTLATEMPSWTMTSLTQEGYRINQYYIDHPEMMIGKLAPDTRYGNAEDCTLVPDGRNLKEELSQCLSTLHTDRPISEARKLKKEIIADNVNPACIPADPDVRNYTYTIHDGNLYFRENAQMQLVTKNGKAVERIIEMHKIRITMRELIDLQLHSCTDKVLADKLDEFSRQYDKFVADYGYITDKANQNAFSTDDDYNLLYGLETKDKEGNVSKADFFRKRTIKPEYAITTVETSMEALNVSLDQRGTVDIEYMAQLTGKQPDDVISELKEVIFLNPAKAESGTYKGYEEAGEYLSGYVRDKLALAKAYAKTNNQYDINVKALEQVQPEPLEPGDITVRHGVTWIDPEDYDQFMYETFDTPMRNQYSNSYYGSVHIQTQHNAYTGEWNITHKNACNNVSTVSTFGTKRINAYEITERLLNQRDVTVKDAYEEDGKRKYVINQKETQIALEKARKIKEAFPKWLWSDSERRNKYVTRYNNMFNNLRGRDYSNIKMSFPGMSPGIELREHQKAAIARAVFNGNSLFAHTVGAGKTFEMSAAVMEKVRLGMITKACVVVPKHLILQEAREWQQLYPQAKLLVATPNDFTATNRNRFMARCLTGDYDAVIMSFEQFEKIKMSYDYRRQFLEREIEEVTQAISESDPDMSVKQLESVKRKLETRMQLLLSEGKKDTMLEFEQLGFDGLVVDEAHYYKNCFVKTKMHNVSGIAVAPAQKSEDMLMKCRYLNETTGYKNIIFATGTPVSNTMVEMYIMQRYLRPDLLKKANCASFDDWAATYGEVVKQLEIKPAGDGYRMKSRFAKFVNLPELMSMYKEFADIVTADMVDLNVPDIKGGKPQIVVAEPSEFQQNVMQDLAKRSEIIHNGCDPHVDNMLKVTNDARLLGLDGRAYDSSSENFSESKVNKCLENVAEIYNETLKEKGVQIIWCDIAVDKKTRGFSVYDYIREELPNRGIPADEVCSIGDVKTDKQRADLFAQLRNGEKRVIIASTSKLGTGANIQDRLAAVHHLDIPWRPSDLEQRNGRIIRQGNTFKEVQIIHYTTEQTFDTYMLNTVTTKQKFISQVMSSKSPARTMEDVDPMVITYSEMQAVTAGNPLIKEKIELDNDISRLSMLEAEYTNSKYRLQDLVNIDLPGKIDKYTSLLKMIQSDVDKVTPTESFAMKIGNVTYTERKEAGDALEKYRLQSKLTGERIACGEYRGFKIDVEYSYNTLCDMGVVNANLVGAVSYKGSLDGENNLGNIIRIENLYKTAPIKRLNEISTELAKANADMEQARKELNEPFECAEELKTKRDRIKVVNDELSIGKEDATNYVDEDKSIQQNQQHSEIEELEIP